MKQYENTSAGIPTGAKPRSSKLCMFAAPEGWQQHSRCQQKWESSWAVPSPAQGSPAEALRAHATAGRGLSLHTGGSMDRKMQFLRTEKSPLFFSALPLIQGNSTRFSNKNIAKDKRIAFNTTW